MIEILFSKFGVNQMQPSLLFTIERSTVAREANAINASRWAGSVSIKRF